MGHHLQVTFRFPGRGELFQTTEAADHLADDGSHLLDVPLPPGVAHEGGEFFAAHLGKSKPHIVIVARVALAMAFTLAAVLKAEMIDGKCMPQSEQVLV